MEIQYFLNVEGIQCGPFTLEDLHKQSLTHETLVWYTGAADWTEARNIVTLQAILAQIPPPIQSSHKTAPFSSALPLDMPSGKKSNRLPVLILACVGVVALLVGFVAFIGNKQQEHRNRIDEQIEFNVANEQQRILDSIKVSGAITEAENRIANLTAEIEVEEAKMNKIKSFHLLRTSAEKDEQIREQSLLIQDLQSRKTETETSLQKFKQMMVGLSR